MIRTGVEDLYVMKDNKRLRCGYTTGSCAAAAAAAAVRMLLTGSAPAVADLMTPKGILLHLPVEEAHTEGGAAVCAVRKDAGDDPDVTDRALICASASFTGAGDIPPHAWMRRGDAVLYLDGGEGVGRITREGLTQKVGEAAINAVPRKMILDAAQAVCEECAYAGSVLIVISVPDGERLAGQTFNLRLGIRRGISILGTSGIVEPMSEEALTESIRLDLSMRVRSGMRYICVAPGRYGEDFVRTRLKLDAGKVVLCSNFVGKTVDYAAELGAEGLLFAAHIGKFIKVAGGIMNTHSREADARAELCAAYALRAGIAREDALRILDTATTDEAVRIMKEAGVLPEAMRLVTAAVKRYLQHRCGGRIRTEAVLYNTSYGLLGMTDGAREMIDRIRGEEKLV